MNGNHGPPAAHRHAIAQWLALALAVLVSGRAIHLLVMNLRDAGWIRLHDILPLYLGARALAGGEDPNAPEVLERIFHELGLGFPVPGFVSFYPPTAALLLLPVSHQSLQRIGPWWLGAMASCLVLAAILLVASAPTRSRVWAVTGAIAIIGVVASMDVTLTTLTIGQVDPLVILCISACAWLISRDREGLAGLPLGAGIAIKFFPLLLLPPSLLMRRWRMVPSMLAVLSALVVIVACLRPAILLAPSMHSTTDLKAWLNPFALVPGVITLLTSLLLTRRGASTEAKVASAILFTAWGGVTLQGRDYHELLFLLPAIGFILAWPFQRGPRVVSKLCALLLLLTVVYVDPVGIRTDEPSRFLLLSLLAWALCLFRFLWTVWTRTPGNPLLHATETPLPGRN